MQKTKLIFLGTMMAILILGSNPTNAQQLVRVGYSGTGVAKNLHKTIDRAGIWKKRGLDVRLIYFTSGATMAQAMVGGDLEVADSDVPAMLNAVSAGALDGNVNIAIQQYNMVIDELAQDPDNAIPVGPVDFYSYFVTRTTTHYSDDILLNGIGYQSMAQLWKQSLAP